LLLRKFKDVLAESKTKNHALVVLGCRLALPPELEREITVVEFKLPDKAQLALVLDGVVESAIESGKKLPPVQTEAALDAAAGLTTTEAENAFALSVVESNDINPMIVSREKAQAINKGGLLELITRRPTLASIGGLDVMKDWLLKRRHAFTKKAREYGLPLPNGLLIIGIAGCGKSQTAKATAEVFGVPLLRLDAGKLFAGLVGGSEANLRAAIQTAEAIAPCCLWIDELEKSFAGSKSSGSTDGGTSARVLGSFLSWMQEKQSPVFVVATANDVQQLPPELLRKGRFDETFFVDLPNQQEREAIWKIVIADYTRDPNDFDIQQLAKMTDGFTGGEIRCAFFDAMFEAFEGDDEPTDLYIAEVLTAFVPLSKLMAEPINELRAWSKGRARLATSAPSLRARARKLAA
jgi:SpoVK/Ycf46/Vps4 family AAA+-type ATPase